MVVYTTPQNDMAVVWGKFHKASFLNEELKSIDHRRGGRERERGRNRERERVFRDEFPYVIQS